MKSYNKNNEFNIAPIEMYELIQDGKISRFPDGYLDKRSSKEILRHITLTKLHMTRKDICEKIDLPFLRKHHISTFRKFWDSQIHQMISYCFPEFKIMPWELKRVPNTFWKNETNRLAFLNWMAKKENLDLTKLEDVRKIKATMVQKHGGIRALRNSGGLYSLICLATGNSIMEWELDKVNVWTEEKVIRAIKWLIEEKLKWNDEQIYNNLTTKIFEENSLDGLIDLFSNSPIKALNAAYPGRFQTLKLTKSP